ncbi:MAG: hypothetical protein ACRELY_01010 [Polyangiaceae bacterium]
MRGFHVADVADACRSVALEFVRGVRHGWAKEELATWLVDSYHPLSLLRLSRAEIESRRTARQGSGIFPTARSSGPVYEPDVVKIMWEAREEALGAVHAFEHGDPSAETFLWRLQSRGTLARIEDERGLRGLVPNELASQRLADRVLSLLACDYVSRPLDYQDRATVCRKCGSISFRDGARQIRDCGEHGIFESGVRTRVEFAEMDLEDDDVDETQVVRVLAAM